MLFSSTAREQPDRLDVTLISDNAEARYRVIKETTERVVLVAYTTESIAPDGAATGIKVRRLNDVFEEDQVITVVKPPNATAVTLVSFVVGPMGMQRGRSIIEIGPNFSGAKTPLNLVRLRLGIKEF